MFFFFSFLQAMTGGYMVAFAGQKYAARSLPVMVTDNSNTITSFTLVSLQSMRKEKGKSPS